MIMMTWAFDVSLFEKLLFRRSTLLHLAGLFKYLTLETVFSDRERRFSVDGRRKPEGKRCFLNFIWISVAGALSTARGERGAPGIPANPNGFQKLKVSGKNYKLKMFLEACLFF